MDNKNLNNNQPKAGVDRDGNMQVRSSGARTPARTPARIPTAPPASAAGGGNKNPHGRTLKKKGPARAASARRPAPPAATPAAPQAEPREYSFATSALFNNEVKERKTDATAVSEAKKVAPAAPLPSTGTKTVNAVTPRRRAQRDTSRAEVTRTEIPRMPIPPAPGSSRAPNVPARPPMEQQRQQPPVPVRDNAFAATRMGPAIKSGAAQRRPGRSTTPIPTPVTGELPRKSPSDNKGGNPFSAMNSVTKSLIYIAAVMLISIILSAVIITNANDIFAFVKDEKTVSITIEPGTDLAELADQLKEEGIIRHKNTFKFFIKFRNKDSDSYAPGTYTVSSTMSYDQIISAITPRTEREMVRITVPEGYTVDEIIDLFVEKGVGDRDEFVRVINEGDFSDYWFVNELPENPDRYYRLEGYLFPDTYYFYTDMSEDTIIRKFLDNFESKFTEEYRTAIASTVNPLTGKAYTVDEIVTLGSIVQAEGKERTVTIEEDSYVDYGLISSVFHNRMELATPMKLQSDATTQFALDMEAKTNEKYRDAKLSDYTDANYTNPYNTYYCNGLPPGAVCNPGLNAISFALWPEFSQYYYFVSDDAGNTHFSKTVDEHLAMVESLK